MWVSKMVLGVVVSISLIGCSGGGDGGSEPLQDDEVNIQEDKTGTIRGVDADSNGVRDDIEQLIDAEFVLSDDEKNSVVEYARSVQTFIEAETEEEVIQQAENLAKSIDCIYATFSDPVEDYEERSKILNTIESWTANTEQRVEKYLSSNQMISGKMLQKTSGNPCE